MAEKLQIQLKEVGSKLQNPPATKDALVELLTQAASSLSELDQSPPKPLMESMRPLLHSIVKPEFLKHQDKEIKLLVATSTCEITRITAPEAPYDDDVLKDIFHLFVDTFSGLQDTKDPSFERIVHILDTVAKYRSFVVMLDLECDDLVNEMFKTFFAVASDEHSEIVIMAMETIMAVLLEESEEIAEDLLVIVLSNLGRNKKDVTPAARKLAMNVIGQCADKLEHAIKDFISSLMSGDKSLSDPEIDYHEVIYDIYRCAPQALSQIIPNLKRELMTDKVDLCLKAVKFVGDLFSIEESTIPKTFNPIFSEFMKRFTDKVVEVRMLVLENVKKCLLSNPSRPEAPELIAALRDRFSDDDEGVRKQAVAVVSDLASMESPWISTDTLKLLSKCLKDKSLLVRKYTMEKLSEIYRKQISDLNSDSKDEYKWIPGRILRCFDDKDLGLDTVEHVLCSSLFPVEFSVKDKVKHWVKLFSEFNKLEVKALENILEQKQRLQLELQKYLSLRQIYKESDSSELQKKAAVFFRSMSHCFIDPIKAESDFQILNQLKDENVWKILTTLLDSNTSSLQSRGLRDELLNIVGEKHPVYELLSTLSTKCSNTIFDKDYVKDLLLEIDQQKSAANKILHQSCMNILVILASFSPLLLSGIEDDLVHLLEDDDEAIKEGVLHVLEKSGETIREQGGERESSSTLDLILERICLEGSRRQAKYAVHALAAITKDDGLKSLSVLYKRLVDILDKKTNLPSVLQSLGCIAQIAMPVFETQESKIEGFIRKDILMCGQKAGGKAKESWDKRSELCSLKIFGIKTLVKSYLPVKDAHLRVGIDELIKDLGNILSLGYISKDVESSSIDKAHLKLASAKAIIRLSKHWDKKIPIHIFHLTLRTSEVGFPQVRKLFLNKVHQYIKNRSLDAKYVCAFLLNFGSQKSILVEENQKLTDILSMQNEGNSLAIYVLPYLIHALAHHPSCPNIDECKDVKAYEPIYRKLYVFFSKLELGDGVNQEDLISMISVVRNIKSSKDAVDTNMSKNSYAICDLSLSIIKRLAQKEADLQESVVPISLPELLYTPIKKKEEIKQDEKIEEKKEDEKIEEIKEDKKKEEEKIEENKEDEKKEDEKIEEKKEDNNKEESKEDKKIEEIKEDEKKEESKQDEKKEEIKEDEKKQAVDLEVTEVQTWLAEESALAHFESLTLDANGNVITSKTKEDDLMKDSETEGNEVPLGKMLKRLKAKGSKARKNTNGSTPPVIETENNVDILGMLREINSDNSPKFDSSNGHGKTKNEANLKRKGISDDLPNVSVPKRRRSSSAKGQKRSSFFKDVSAFNKTKTDDDDLQSGSEDNKVILGTSLIEPVDSGDKSGDRNTDEKVKKYVEDDSNQKLGPIKKRKQKRVSGLAKCTSDDIETETETNTRDLIGKQIKVWWPLDKAFYGGFVKSYDDQKKKHVVLYDDGDIEVLCLNKERWELVENEHKPTKRKRMSISSTPKRGSSLKRIKSSGSSKQTKDSTDVSPSSMVRGKRTPRKNLKQGKKGVSQRSAYLEIGSSKDRDESKVDNMDTEETLSNKEGSSAGEMENSKQTKDAESSSSDHAMSHEENETDSGQKETEKVTRDDTGSDENGNKEKLSLEKDSSSENSTKEAEEVHNQEESGESESKESTSGDSEKAEYTDDELLGAWKSRVKKSVEGK